MTAMTTDTPAVPEETFDRWTEIASALSLADLLDEYHRARVEFSRTLAVPDSMMVGVLVNEISRRVNG